MKNDNLTLNSVESLNSELPIIECSAFACCPRLCSKDLFVSCNEVIIEHAGEQYRLRLTRQGKLILTK